ncbi:hypothetical protein JOB18_009678 [Solea senegalensis]|uniref:Uncharacterized protein n=1 Tax=Solea senegalensis TaxID=28829 RepID=A0AAV6SKX8_SOLSE|nr:hypothetical protein JOB18_009678 [Solea senegalensis]
MATPPPLGSSGPGEPAKSEKEAALLTLEAFSPSLPSLIEDSKRKDIHAWSSNSSAYIAASRM